MFFIKKDGGLVEQTKKIQRLRHQDNGVDVLTDGDVYDAVYSLETDRVYEMGVYAVVEVPDEVAVLIEENKLLKAKTEALTERNAFHEDLIAEMASVVYA